MKLGVIFPQDEIGADPIAIRDYVQAVCCDPCEVLQLRLESGPKEGPDHEAIEVYGRAGYRCVA